MRLCVYLYVFAGLCVCVIIDTLPFSLSLSHAGLQLDPRCHGNSAQHWSGYFVYPLFYLRTAPLSESIYATTIINSCEYYNESAASSGPWQKTYNWLKEDDDQRGLCHHLG